MPASWPPYLAYDENGILRGGLVIVLLQVGERSENYR